MLRRKLVIHHSAQPNGVFTNCGRQEPIDYLLDRYATVVTNYESVCAKSAFQQGDRGTITLCIEGNYEQNPVSVNVDRGVKNFIKHLCRVASIHPQDIVAHHKQHDASEFIKPELCPGIYMRECLAAIRSELEGLGEELHRVPDYDATLEIHGVVESPDGFKVVGWVANTGHSSWYGEGGQWHVSLGLRVLGSDHSILLEKRYPPASGGVAPGEGFAFQLEASVSYASCVRLEMGLVIENKFWFSNSGLLPLTFAGPMRGSIVLPKAEDELQSAPVAVIALLDKGMEHTSDEWIREGAYLDHSLVYPDRNTHVRGSLHRGSVETCAAVIAECDDRDVVIVSHGVRFQDDAWLAKLRRSAYAEPSIAAVSAKIVDESSRVLDIGGVLYSSGYTHSPGFLKGLCDREVVMHREPGFLPAGAVYIRRDALKRVGPLNHEWKDLQLALIEWCYRARPHGMKVRIEHSAVASVPASYLAAASRSPISGYSRRLKLLQRLSDVIIEGRYA